MVRRMPISLMIHTPQRLLVLTKRQIPETTSPSKTMATTGESPKICWSYNCDYMIERANAFLSSIKRLADEIDAMRSQQEDSEGNLYDSEFLDKWDGLHRSAWKLRNEEWPNLDRYDVWLDRSEQVEGDEKEKMLQLCKLVADCDAELDRIPKISTSGQDDDQVSKEMI